MGNIIDYMLFKYRAQTKGAIEYLKKMHNGNLSGLEKATLVEQVRLTNLFVRDLENLKNIMILMESIKET